jgi:hypothetical protein
MVCGAQERAGVGVHGRMKTDGTLVRARVARCGRTRAYESLGADIIADLGGDERHQPRVGVQQVEVTQRTHVQAALLFGPCHARLMAVLMAAHVVDEQAKLRRGTHAIVWAWAESHRAGQHRTHAAVWAWAESRRAGQLACLIADWYAQRAKRACSIADGPVVVRGGP